MQNYYENDDILHEFHKIYSNTVVMDIDEEWTQWLFREYTVEDARGEKVDIGCVNELVSIFISIIRDLRNANIMLQLEKDVRSPETSDGYNPAERILDMVNRMKKENDEQKKTIDNQRKSITGLELKNESLTMDREVYRKTLDAVKGSGEINGNHMERALVKNGRKTAHIEEASEAKVYDCLLKGYRPTRIARELNVSVETVYRRKKALEKKGIYPKR